MLLDDWFNELFIDQIIKYTEDVLRNESIQRTLMRNDVCRLKLIIFIDYYADYYL